MKEGSSGKGIQVYKEINDFLEAAGFRQRTSDPLFFCLRLEDTYPDVKPVMPPFRKEFYLVAMARSEGQSQFRLNERTFDNPRRYLVFQSPGHILSWQRGEGLRGYLVYFREECLSFFRYTVSGEFRFFDLLHSNFFHISEEVFNELAPAFESLITEQALPYSFKERVLYAQLLALLYRCKSFYAGFHTNLVHQNPAGVIAQRYHQLINNYFLEKRTVEEFASLLHITPGHLNEMVKRTTGRTASALLADKLLQEAKNLIAFTSHDIAEISYLLNFSSPAHFNRFFKQHSGITPLAYRKTGVSPAATVK